MNIFRKSAKTQVSLKSDKKTGALCEEPCPFVIVSRQVRLRGLYLAKR